MTLPQDLRAAIAMYRTFGFREIPSHCENPVEGAIFLELEL